MTRLLLTFPSIHQVLAADKAIRASNNFLQSSDATGETAAKAASEATPLPCRTTPTPPELSGSICGMSLEILNIAEKNAILAFLRSKNLIPAGVHELDK